MEGNDLATFGLSGSRVGTAFPLSPLATQLVFLGLSVIKNYREN